MPNVSNDLSQKLYATMEKHKEVRYGAGCIAGPSILPLWAKIKEGVLLRISWPRGGRKHGWQLRSLLPIGCVVGLAPSSLSWLFG